MRTIETKVYKFEELTKEAQSKAIEKCYDINVCHDWWECTYNDAKTIEAQIAYSYSGDTITDFWFGTTGYFGKEDDNDDGWRNLLTFVGSMTHIETF